MTKEEAIILLIACQPLAERLAESQNTTDITTDDVLETVRKFYQVYRSGWQNDPDVLHQAGLNSEDIKNLNSARFRLLAYKGANIHTCFACSYLLMQMDEQGPDYKLTDVNRETLREFGKLMEIHWIEKNQGDDKGWLLRPAQIDRLNSLLAQVQEEDKQNSI